MINSDILLLSMMAAALLLAALAALVSWAQTVRFYFLIEWLLVWWKALPIWAMLTMVLYLALNGYAK